MRLELAVTAIWHISFLSYECFLNLEGSKHFLFSFCMEMQRRGYDELSLNTCTHSASRWRKKSRE